MALIVSWKGLDHLGGSREGAVTIRIDERDKRLRQPRQIPLRDPWLIGVGIATLRVDGAEHGCRIIMIHEGAWAVVDGLTGDRHVVGVHHAMDEARMHPA